MPSTKHSSRRASPPPRSGAVPDEGIAVEADGDDGDDDLVALPESVGGSSATPAGPAPSGAVSEALAPRALVVTEALSGQRLDKALAVLLPEFSRSRLQAWIESGAVLLNGASARIRQTVLGGDKLHVAPEAPSEASAFLPESVPLEFVHEDETLAVLNKQPGLVVHPAAGNWSGTLLNGLLHRYADATGLPRAGIVHRLDKGTSGLMVVARTLAAQTDLVRQLQARTVKRTYLAVVWGVPPVTGTIDRPIARDSADRLRMAVSMTDVGREARTHFRRLAVGSAGNAPVALVRCQLETGRTHQIRVHMEALGHPLVGDPVYRRAGRGVARVPVDFSRQALHAARLGLEHPRRREPVQWSVPLPDDMRALFIELGLPTDVDLE